MSHIFPLVPSSIPPFYSVLFVVSVLHLCLYSTREVEVRESSLGPNEVVS